MTIKTKILSLVAAFALLALAITALSLKTMDDYNHSIDSYRQASDNAFRGERLNRYLTAAALAGRTLYMASDQAQAKAATDQIDAIADQLTSLVEDWDKHIKPGELPEFEAVHSEVMTFVADGRTLARVTRDKGLGAANTYGNHPEYVHSRENMQANIDSMVARIEAEQARSRAALQKFESERQTQFMIIAITGILLLAGGSFWIAIDSITTPLSQVRQSMIKISEGAYDTPIPTDHASTEISELWGALAVLKARAVEAEKLSEERLKDEQKLRELMLD